MSFDIEEIGDGRSRAVFKDEDEMRRKLLSGFLQDAPHFVTDILYEISLVERRHLASSGFESSCVIAQFFPDHALIIDVNCVGNKSARIVLTLLEAKLLLLQWGVALIRQQMNQTVENEIH